MRAIPSSQRRRENTRIWLAADIPQSLRSEVTLVIDGKVLKITDAPVSFYGLDLAWYKFGKVDLKETSEIRLQVSPKVTASIKVDVLVASPGAFRPDGSKLPLDFLTPGR